MTEIKVRPPLNCSWLPVLTVHPSVTDYIYRDGKLTFFTGCFTILWAPNVLFQKRQDAKINHLRSFASLLGSYSTRAL